MNKTPREQAIDEFTAQWPDTLWGPAHLLMADYNVGDGDIRYCQQCTREAIDAEGCWLGEQQDMDALQATSDFLERLLDIPDES